MSTQQQVIRGSSLCREVRLLGTPLQGKYWCSLASVIWAQQYILDLVLSLYYNRSLFSIFEVMGAFLSLTDITFPLQWSGSQPSRSPLLWPPLAFLSEWRRQREMSWGRRQHLVLPGALWAACNSPWPQLDTFWTAVKGMFCKTLRGAKEIHKAGKETKGGS